MRTRECLRDILNVYGKCIEWGWEKFLSHSSLDKEYVGDIADRLEKR